ncbi:MAG: topoisomerase C-terminal repeat-containing protein, partial [Alphaproteobacteria bacterium]
ETPMTNGEDKAAKGKKKKAADKPKRVSLPKGLPPAEIDFDKALALLALPREIGVHPESGQNITAGLGRYGPYLKHGPAYISLTGDDDVLSIGLNRAVVVIAEAGAKGSRNGGRELGVHPGDEKKITVGKGRFGPYVRHGKTFASLPRDASMDDITLQQAVELIDAKLAKTGTAKKPAAKKTTKKKAKKTAKKTK